MRNTLPLWDEEQRDSRELHRGLGYEGVVQRMSKKIMMNSRVEEKILNAIETEEYM